MWTPTCGHPHVDTHMWTPTCGHPHVDTRVDRPVPRRVHPLVDPLVDRPDPRRVDPRVYRPDEWSHELKIEANAEPLGEKQASLTTIYTAVLRFHISLSLSFCLSISILFQSLNKTICIDYGRVRCLRNASQATRSLTSTAIKWEEVLSSLIGGMHAAA
jgi:hypothetical protein